MKMEMMDIPRGLQPWAKRLGKILTKPYPPKASPNLNQKPQWEKFSNWSLICENVLDTEPDPRFIRICYDELIRRGLSNETIQQMHFFAWLTAGWLNYEKCLWEWCHLGQNEIEKAIQWQVDDKLITEEEQKHMLTFVKEYEGANKTSAPYQ
jgi:hypothetical protein